MDAADRACCRGHCARHWLLEQRAHAIQRVAGAHWAHVPGFPTVPEHQAGSRDQCQRRPLPNAALCADWQAHWLGAD